MLKWFAVAAMAVSLSACGQESGKDAKKEEPKPEATAPTIVLLHGAFMDASAWNDVEADLEARGRNVVAVNLPGRPSNPAPTGEQTLDKYRDAVLAAMSGETRPVVLVGHSFGGMTISNVAEAAPEKIAALVYVAAYLPKSGDSLQSLSATDKDSKTGPSFRVDAARLVAFIDPATRGDLFCNDCTPETKTRAAGSMVEEPLPPPGQPVTLSEKFAGVKKVYIRTGQDQVVSPYLQDQMMAVTPVQEVVKLDTGHSPFFSQPKALADAIDAVR
jgi:pimeloyl-ACP methyl ester carboxylesterase